MTSLDNRGKVVVLSEEGYSQSERLLLVLTAASVNEILTKQRLTGNVRDVNIPGKKRKTTRREDTFNDK